ncbi:MAG: hypothetical protein IK096_07050 [Lachnospiraceae bacterium]|nr:hypothetical protein [Lachnospiraceae bacterium]
MAEEKERQYPPSILPKDWDKPSEENAQLCRLYLRKICRDGGISMPLRYFVPQGEREAVPLVVYLHGADAIGLDNELQLSMHDIGTMFARDAWQKKHPCFILAPQCEGGLHWSMPQVGEALQHIVEDFVSHDPRIDRRRIYLYGYSAGAVGLLELLKVHTDFYAAAISICGATGPRQIDRLTGTPLWMIHAADDRIVKASYGDGTEKRPNYMGSRNIYSAMQGKTGRELKYSEYPEGYMEKFYGVNPHCSWVAVSDPGNPQYGEWLFSHVRGDGDHGGMTYVDH